MRNIWCYLYIIGQITNFVINFFVLEIVDKSISISFYIYYNDTIFNILVC